MGVQGGADNVFALFVLVSLIVRNGGNPITVRERGVLRDGLPPLPQGALSQLRRNGYLLTSQEGTGTRVGPGPRVREIAAKWNIALPDPARTLTWGSTEA